MCTYIHTYIHTVLVAWTSAGCWSDYSLMLVHYQLMPCTTDTCATEVTNILVMIIHTVEFNLSWRCTCGAVFISGIFISGLLLKWPFRSGNVLNVVFSLQKTSSQCKWPLLGSEKRTCIALHMTITCSTQCAFYTKVIRWIRLCWWKIHLLLHLIKTNQLHTYPVKFRLEATHWHPKKLLQRAEPYSTKIFLEVEILWACQ